MFIKEAPVYGEHVSERSTKNTSSQQAQEIEQNKTFFSKTNEKINATKVVVTFDSPLTNKIHFKSMIGEDRFFRTHVHKYTETRILKILLCGGGFCVLELTLSRRLGGSVSTGPLKVDITCGNSNLKS